MDVTAVGIDFIHLLRDDLFERFLAELYRILHRIIRDLDLLEYFKDLLRYRRVR
jgi:hypothetical protein